MKPILVLLIPVLIFSSCNQNSKDKKSFHFVSESKDQAPTALKMEEVESADSMVKVSKNYDANLSAPPPLEKKAVYFTPPIVNHDNIPQVGMPKKLVKTATMRIEVGNYQKCIKEVQNIITQHKGYTSSESETAAEQTIENKMEIKASGSDFDSILDRVQGIAKHVDSKEVKLEDVTSEYVDLELRIKAKKEIVARYVDMLSKAKKVDDLVEVQGKIDEINEETEEAEGRLKLLGNQIQYSTLNLEIYQKLPFTPTSSATNGPGFFYRFGHALTKGWGMFLELIIITLSLWPLFIAALVGLVFWKRYRGRRVVKG